MPGIVGFTRGAEPIENARYDLQSMQDSVTHYYSYVKHPLFCDEKVCATSSHVNKSRKTLQPYAQSGVFVWCDGELLDSKNDVPHAEGKTLRSDELLCALYCARGELSFLRDIDGNYAAVIYDSLRGNIHLITDRYGTQHLYWTVQGKTLRWASELKAIVTNSSHSLRISVEALHEFLEVGYQLNDHTWFDGVHLLPSGTVLTWDLRSQSSTVHRYWWWDEIAPITGKIDIREAAEETGRLFAKAVERRFLPGERVGLYLSGGLDSRAILAAMPGPTESILAVTFGIRRCDEISIASAAARKKGIEQLVTELDHSNWLGPRIGGVWYTDGECNLLHLHGIETIPVISQLLDVAFNGIAGDVILGGKFLRGYPADNMGLDAVMASRIMRCDPAAAYFPRQYLQAPKSDYYFLDQRVRRFTWGGPKYLHTVMQVRRPFLDNALVEFTYSLPDSMRYRQGLYRRMLLHRFRPYFDKIPWQKTLLPIHWPLILGRISELVLHERGRIVNTLASHGVRVHDRHDFADYPRWIRENPARTYFLEMLHNPKALYPNFLSRERVISELQEHFQGKDRSERLCRYVTFEVFLQQTFEQRLRPGMGA